MSNSAKAHGLDGSLVAPDWPPLTAEEVSAVLAQYPALSQPFELLTVSPRPFSAASLVQAGPRQVFVKRHARSVRNGEGLREEHRFMAHLRSRGLPIPEVLTNSRGDSVLQSEQWTYEVHAGAAGSDRYGDAISWTPFEGAEHARAAGEMNAALHRAANDYDAPGRSGRPLIAGFTIFAAEDAQAGFERYISRLPSLCAFLQNRDWWRETLELLTPFHRELLPLLPALPPLWTHNDLHASNLFWSQSPSQADITGVIDFGLCDRTHAVHDLAHTIERNIIGWLDLMNDPTHPEAVPVQSAQLASLLEGYENVRPLGPEERAALAPMLALCHVEFALSEADYFLSALDDEEKARVACEDYMLGHARWWRGSGEALLDEVHTFCAARDGAHLK